MTNRTGKNVLRNSHSAIRTTGQRNYVMKIGFDARMIHHSGIGIYIANLLRSLLVLGKEHSITLYGPKEELESLVKETGHLNATCVECSIPIYSIKEQFSHPALKEQFDVLHIPHYNIPVRYKGKMVVTIHDINHLKFTDFLPNRLARHYAHWMLKQCYKKDVIAVSEATSIDLKNMFGKKGNAPTVIHEALRGDFQDLDPNMSLDYLKSKHRLPKQFVLFVGNLKPNKNIIRLIESYRQIKDALPEGWGVVLVGKKFPQHPEIIQAIAEAEKEGWLRYLSEISSEQLRGIYELAEIFCFVSLQEGFGLPLLEAFATECAVIASKVSSLPEIAGNGAVLVNPFDIEAIKESLLALIKNEDLRADLIRKGKKELERFSWDKAALETLRVYEKARVKGETKTQVIPAKAGI